MKPSFTKLPAAILAAFITFTPCSIQAARHALLVGVAEYENPDSNLRFPEKDVELMKSYLIQQHGFADAEIRTLLSAKATAANVKNELAGLVARAQPGDSVVFYFSGHGSQVTDYDGDEVDGLDETLCAYDYVSSDRDTHLTDDVLREYLGALKTDRTLVVMDCCHSGTGTRVGGNPAKSGIKMIPSAFHPGPPQSTRGRPGASMKSIVRSDVGLRHLLIAGCAADEVSYELPQIGGGLVTHAFVNLGRDENIEVPISKIAMGIRTQAIDWVNNYLPGAPVQNVQFEGSAAGTLRELLAKEGPKIEVVAPPASNPAADQARDVLLTIKTSKEVYRAGEKMSVSVTPDRACHLRLYYTDKDGKSFLIFPNKFQQDDKIAVGQEVEIGGEGAKFAFQLTFPEDFEGDEVGETITAVASTKPFTDPIESWGESTFLEISGVGRGALTTRGVSVRQKPGLAVAPYRIRRP